MVAQISRKDAEKFKPRKCEVNDKPATVGKRIGYNSGMYGWNWDLVVYRGKYYVYGYRNFPKTYGKYKGE